jgi:type III secretion protein S
MNSTEIVYLSSQALKLMLMLSLPVVLTGAVIGLTVGLLQGLTQIQDQTISFALRLIGSMVMLMFTSRWMGNELYKFTIDIFERIIFSSI